MRHQEEGVDFLLRNRIGLLAFEQGLGKTLVAIEAFRRLRWSRAANLMLVICPNSLKGNWRAEVARFAPDLRVRVISGTMRERREDLTGVAEDIVVINYEAARAEIIALRALMVVRKTVLVLDESHNVKNRRSLTTVAAQHLALSAEYRWLLTGTPVTNSPEDIYSQLAIVAGERGAKFEMFMLDYGNAGSDPSVHKRLAEHVAPYLLRRTKEQCLDLPEKTFVDLTITLPPWQRALYDSFRDGFIRDVEAMSPEAYSTFASTALTRLLRLSQIASNPRLILPGETRLPAKISELDALMEEIVAANGRKVIVWSYYVGTIQQILERYRTYGAVALFGGVPSEDRQEIARRFQEDPDIRVLVGNPAAAGTGFTLTAATYAIYETLNWRYDFYAQSQDRNHRIGQRVPVTYIRLLAADTIDRVITQALERKAAMSQTIVGDDPTSFSIADLNPEEFCLMLKSNELPSRLATA
ncbi:MAG TPA: DEAD/DEAH box helicase [Longimicrobium sp.]